MSCCEALIEVLIACLIREMYWKGDLGQVFEIIVQYNSRTYRIAVFF